VIVKHGTSLGTLGDSSSDVLQGISKMRESIRHSVCLVVVLDIDCLTTPEGNPTGAVAVKAIELASSRSCGAGHGLPEKVR
jgi:anti-sigma-K factor RskA